MPNIHRRLPEWSSIRHFKSFFKTSNFMNFTSFDRIGCLIGRMDPFSYFSTRIKLQLLNQKCFIYYKQENLKEDWVTSRKCSFLTLFSLTQLGLTLKNNTKQTTRQNQQNSTKSCSKDQILVLNQGIYQLLKCNVNLSDSLDYVDLMKLAFMEELYLVPVLNETTSMVIF